MSALQFRSREQLANYADGLLKLRARNKAHSGLWQLGRAGRHSLLAHATLQLLHPSPADPLMLLTKRDRERMQRRPKPIANISFDAPRWAAFVNVYRQLFELSDFGNAKTDAEKSQLIDRAIWNAQKALTRKTKSVADGVHRDKMFELARHTETGSALTAEPARDLELQRAEDAEKEADAVRAAVEALEVEHLRDAVNAYARTLKRAHRRVVTEVIKDPTASASAIASHCNVKAATVFRIRDELYALREKYISKRRPEVNSIEVDAPTAAADAALQGVTYALEFVPDALKLDAPKKGAPAADWSARTLESATLDQSARVYAEITKHFHAPDIDADLAENVLGAYAKRGESARVLGSRWGIGGKRMYGDVELVTGNYKDWDDPRKILERKQNARWANRFNQTEMRHLRQKDAPLVSGMLAHLDAFIAEKKLQAEIAKAELAALRAERQLHVAREVLKIKNSELADLRAFAEMLCEGSSTVVDELLAGTIGGPKPS